MPVGMMGFPGAGAGSGSSMHPTGAHTGAGGNGGNFHGHQMGPGTGNNADARSAGSQGVYASHHQAAAYYSNYFPGPAVMQSMMRKWH